MNGSAPAGWLVPDWPAPANVRALCSSRDGGVSAGPYASLNLGDHVGDDPLAVAENRDRFASALDAKPVFLKQVHGAQVVHLTDRTAHGTEADGCITRERKLACTIMVADCLPVLFTDDAGRCVAAAHAGWRGLAGQGGSGVLESLWNRFWPEVGASPAEAARRTLVWLGPCIGPSSFEVGGEVMAAFEATDANAGRRFAAGPAGKWLADLAGLAKDRLAALELARVYGNDSSAAWCTVTNPSRFFSHRRDRISGRFAASIWLS